MKYFSMILIGVLFVVGCSSAPEPADDDNSGNTPSPEIMLVVGSTEIASGSSTYNFDNIPVSTSSSAIEFTIHNTGNATLTISVVGLTGGDTGMFTIDQSALSTSLNTGAYSSFTITFSPTAQTNYSATVAIGNNDPDESSFVFTVAGTGSAPPEPEIQVWESSNQLTSEVSTYDFGNVDPDYFGLVIIAISNTGASNLILQEVGITGDNEFTVGTLSTTNITNDERATFTISYNPSIVETNFAIITITNNDSDEGLFSFTVIGRGNNPPTAEFLPAEYYIVSGAGSNNINGNYYPAGYYTDDLAVDRQWYTNITSTNTNWIFYEWELFPLPGHFWWIGTNTNKADAFYVSTNGLGMTNTLPQSSWEVENGASPAPTVSPYPMPITGIPEIGQELTAHYTYNDEDGHSENNSIYKWYFCDTADDDGFENPIYTGTNYTTSFIPDNNKYIKFSVTPVDQYGMEGTTIKSGAFGPITN